MPWLTDMQALKCAIGKVLGEAIISPSESTMAA
jgi:hypothetical protein